MSASCHSLSVVRNTLKDCVQASAPLTLHCSELVTWIAHLHEILDPENTGAMPPKHVHTQHHPVYLGFTFTRHPIPVFSSPA